MLVKLSRKATPLPYALTARSLSGTVEAGGLPVARQVLVYQNGLTSPVATTYSSKVDGSWSVAVTAGSNDRHRIVIVGEGGEYSKVFENVVAG